MTSPSEPRNPLYLLLLAVSFLFVLNALAYAIVPTLEDKAELAGQPAPPSDLRDSLRRDGWKWLLVELAGMVVLGLASMGLDRWRLRRLQLADSPGTMPSVVPPSVGVASTSDPVASVFTVPHDPRTTGSGSAQADQSP